MASRRIVLVLVTAGCLVFPPRRGRTDPPAGGPAAGESAGGAAPVAPPPGATGGAPDVGVTASSIKVGHIGIYSGPVGSFGDDLSYAGRAKLQEINDTGGINGRKLDLLVRDRAWDGTKGLNAARHPLARGQVSGTRSTHTGHNSG